MELSEMFKNGNKKSVTIIATDARRMGNTSLLYDRKRGILNEVVTKSKEPADAQAPSSKIVFKN